MLKNKQAWVYCLLRDYWCIYPHFLSLKVWLAATFFLPLSDIRIYTPESLLPHFALQLNCADASSNMYFGRWKKLMIKGTPSDFHLNYNLSLIFLLFISHFFTLAVLLHYLSPICIFYLYFFVGFLFLSWFSDFFFSLVLFFFVTVLCVCV